MEGVTVDGHHPECPVTFGRGVVRLVSPFNGELSFIMAAVLWSDRFVNKKLRKFEHRMKTF